MIHTTSCASSTLVRSLTSEAAATLIHAFTTARLITAAHSMLASQPLWAHSQKCFQLYSKCAPLAPLPTEDFIPYNFFSLAVPPGPCSSLSSRPLLHYHWYSGSSLSPLYRAGFLLVPFAHTAIMQNRAFSVVGPSLWNGLSLYPRILSNSFYAHLKTFLFSRTGIGSPSD